MIKVAWPQKIALVAKKAQMDKPEEEWKRDAYEMGFSKERIISKTVEILANEVPQDLTALAHTYKCAVWGAYYLSRVFVRPLDGKMLPTGNLSVVVDGEVIIKGPISAFLPDPEPLDCTKSYPWEQTRILFIACAYKDGQAYAAHQYGFMLPNDTQVKVKLAGVTAEEVVSLEVSALTAYYSTKVGEIPEKKS